MMQVEYKMPERIAMTKITRLSEDIRNNPAKLSKIRYPDMFFNALNELDNNIGNQQIKDDICSQIRYLMEEYHSNPGENMLNTVIYGPPGTGKTTMGLIMAKIWYSMGFLKKRNRIGLDDIFDLLTENKEKTEVYILLIAIVFKYIATAVGYIVRTFLNYGKSGKIFMLFMMILVAYYIYRAFLSLFEEREEDPSKLFKIVSREHFVDRYMGWSEKKTISLMESSIGQVLFVDEAYSLYNSPQDSFGMEALTAMNRFMSEHPGEIFVIFAGYENLMKEGIFKVQPGLPRRFMWHLNCPGYNDCELYDILNYHLDKSGWKIHKEDKNLVKNLIKENYSAFKAFAGDINKLIFFSKLDYTEHNGMMNVLEFENIKYGVQKLLTNNVY